MNSEWFQCLNNTKPRETAHSNKTETKFIWYNWNKWSFEITKTNDHLKHLKQRSFETTEANDPLKLLKQMIILNNWNRSSFETTEANDHFKQLKQIIIAETEER